ncbi:MAG: GLPGLI family protein [Sphingobacteriales bacterium]|nr:MAG: GLPGLI family protein [Sphingobacteriales bacterium]
MRLFILLCAFLFAGPATNAQFTFQGKIEYERKMNVHRTIDGMDEDDKSWAEKFRSTLPKFHTSYFDLYFSPGKTLYKPGREVEDNPKMWFATPPDIESIIYTDTKAGSVKANRKIYEEKFLVQDSMRKLKWKIHNEIRTIANYKCRKAVSKICDSVYVVAFYTEDIPVSGGPEMFSGLPGMVLEVAIPRLYTTWVATKVDMITPKTEDFAVTDKGKKVNMSELHETVYSSLKRWGKSSQRYVWWSVL